jgi:PcfJ-like protein
MPPEEEDLQLGERPARAGCEFVVRPFTPSMSLKTAMMLSADWHEAVANNLDGSNSAFPNPWYPAARLGDYEILPIEDAASLYREGTAMHHCVGTYGDQVQLGSTYIYSIRRNGERVATLALGRDGGRAYLDQIRGPCNTDPPKTIVGVARRWLRAQKPLPPQEVLPAADVEWWAA